MEEVAEGSFWWFVDRDVGGFFRRSFRGAFFVVGSLDIPLLSSGERSGARAGILTAATDGFGEGEVWMGGKWRYEDTTDVTRVMMCRCRPKGTLDLKAG